MVASVSRSKTKTIVAIDPGKLNMAYMCNEDKQSLRYTAPQRKVESLGKRCDKIMHREKQKSNIIEAETTLSSHCCKSVNIDIFKNYIKEKTKVDNQVRGFYEQELYRKLKWRKQIYRRKSEDTFLNRIEKTYGKKEDLLLCYGDWSRCTQMKGIMSTMGVGLRRIIGKKFKVVLVNEYNTSKLCSKCHEELEHYKNIYRVLVCRGCKSGGLESKNTTFMQRDMNACMNMIHIAKSWIDSKTLPVEFCRTQVPAVVCMPSDHDSMTLSKKRQKRGKT